MTYVSQMSLVTAILTELDHQEPGATVSQTQMNAIIYAANLIVLALRHGSPTLTKKLDDIGAAITILNEL